ncbi:hypothetical protein AB1I63_09060 [Streptococcus pneumoniae]
MARDILAYRLGKRKKSGSMSAESIFDAHYYHALEDLDSSDGKSHKVLFTTKTKINKKDLKKVIIVANNFQKALIASIDHHETYDKAKPNPAYRIPSQWERENKEIEIPQNYHWFELYDVQAIDDEELSKYKNGNNSLKHSLGGRKTAIYVEKSE